MTNLQQWYKENNNRIHIEAVYNKQNELKVILGGEKGPPLFLELTFSEYSGYRSFDESLRLSLDSTSDEIVEDMLPLYRAEQTVFHNLLAKKPLTDVTPSGYEHFFIYTAIQVLDVLAPLPPKKRWVEKGTKRYDDIVKNLKKGTIPEEDEEDEEEYEANFYDPNKPVPDQRTVAKWEPLQDISFPLTVEKLSDDYGGLTLLLQEKNNSKYNLRMSFLYDHYGYQKLPRPKDEQKCHDYPILDTDWSLFKAARTPFTEWIVEESYKLIEITYMIHFVIVTEEHIYEILSPVSPTVEWVPR